MTTDEINSIKYMVCCPVCDNNKCVKGTDSCEAEQWAKRKAESEEIKMSKLEKAKEIIKANYGDADCGIFSCHNWVGDDMTTVYEGEGLTIDVCYGYAYFEVYGLSDEDFSELENYYDSLRKVRE